MVTLFLDKDTWADLSLELEERNLTKRPGDDIRLPKAKKQRLDIIQATGKNQSQSDSSEVEKIVELLETALKVPSNLSATLPSLEVVHIDYIKDFMQNLKQVH